MVVELYIYIFINLGNLCLSRVWSFISAVIYVMEWAMMKIFFCGDDTKQFIQFLHLTLFNFLIPFGCFQLWITAYGCLDFSISFIFRSLLFLGKFLLCNVVSPTIGIPIIYMIFALRVLYLRKRRRERLFGMALGLSAPPIVILCLYYRTGLVFLLPLISSLQFYVLAVFRWLCAALFSNWLLVLIGIGCLSLWRLFTRRKNAPPPPAYFHRYRRTATYTRRTYYF